MKVTSLKKYAIVVLLISLLTYLSSCFRISILIEPTSSSTTSSSTADVSTTEVTTEVTEIDPSIDPSKVISVAASSTPHADILEQCRPILEKQGYFLDIKIVDDYVIPNLQVENFVVLANYFQHVAYMNSFNAENATHLISVANIHYEPLGLYAGKTKSLSNLQDGATIAISNEAHDRARAILLLADAKIIKIKDNSDLNTTLDDIIDNPHNIKFVEIESSLIPQTLSNVDFAVINPNYALGAGLKVSEALAAETSDSEAARTYGNILAVKAGNEEDERVKALVSALTSKEISDYIIDTYDGAVQPMHAR